MPTNISSFKTASIPPFQQWRYASFALFAILLFIICATFLDYGVTWDEPARKEYGYRVLLWYSSLFQNDAAIQNILTNIYGGFFEATAQLLSGIVILYTGLYLYETRHLLNALFGLIGIVYTYRLGKLIAGEKAGFLSALILAITPRYYGHMFNNSKDIPFAVLSLISLYYIIYSYRHFPNLPKRLILKLGISIGLTLGIRIGGLLLYFYFLLLFFAWLICSFYKDKKIAELPPPSLLKILSGFGTSFLSVMVISWTIMLFWWPWAQIAPIRNPLHALSKLSEFPWRGSIFYKGEFIKASDVPWDYIPTWLSITLPEFYFFSIFLGGISVLKYIEKLKSEETILERQFVEISFLVFFILFPVLYIIYKQSVLYDGIRHLLFIIPLISVICGISFNSIFRYLKSQGVKYIVIGIALFLGALTIYDMISLHPYENIYFNRIFGGGLSVAAQRYETDYWGNSYKAAAEWVVEHYSDPSSQQYKVAVCFFPQEILSYYLNPSRYIQQELQRISSHLANRSKILAPDIGNHGSNQELFTATEMEDSDIILAYRRLDCHRRIRGIVQHTISREGVPLAYVFGPDKE